MRLKYDKNKKQLTALDIRNIKLLLQKNTLSAKINRKEYHITIIDPSNIIVNIPEKIFSYAKNKNEVMNYKVSIELI